MSIRSVVGNITHGAQDDITSLLNIAQTQMENIVGSAQAAFTNLWSGGFVGMSESGIEAIKEALTKYCNEVENLIQEFDENGNIEVALKGETQQAAAEFIAAVKRLLQAYVSTMRASIKDADEAYKNWSQSSKSIATDVASDAENIRSNAEKIRID